MNEEKMTIHGHLRRLPLITVPNAIYFVTTCCQGRRAILNNPEAVAILREEWGSAHERHGWLVGRYVVMPNHIHLFCAPAAYPAEPIRAWTKYWKTLVSKAWPRPEDHPLWQKDCWDTQLRRGENYEAKWRYVIENPVRQGLVKASEEWSYQGELNVLAWHDE